MSFCTETEQAICCWGLWSRPAEADLRLHSTRYTPQGWGERQSPFAEGLEVSRRGVMNQVPGPVSRFRGNDRTGAAECCREFEGVPQFSFFSIPQEWGTKGVEKRMFSVSLRDILQAGRGEGAVISGDGGSVLALASPPRDCFVTVIPRNDALVLERGKLG